MIDIDIPGFGPLRLEHLVLDFNGTLAVDGDLMPGVAERLNALSAILTVHVVTADTFGKARTQLNGVNCRIRVLSGSGQDLEKRAYVEALGAGRTACIGNGRNDALMLETAGLGIAVLLAEGVAGRSLTAADILCQDILSALDLFTHPLRLTATLRA